MISLWSMISVWWGSGAAEKKPFFFSFYSMRLMCDLLPAENSVETFLIQGVDDLRKNNLQPICLLDEFGNPVAT